MHDNVGEDHVNLQEKKEAYREKDEEEAEEDHLSPSYVSLLICQLNHRDGPTKKSAYTVPYCRRWWFATTLFPLIAGTFGPMASAFSLCALIEHWRLTQDPTSTESEGPYVSDPSW